MSGTRRIVEIGLERAGFKLKSLVLGRIRFQAAVQLAHPFAQSTDSHSQLESVLSTMTPTYLMERRFSESVGEEPSTPE